MSNLEWVRLGKAAAGQDTVARMCITVSVSAILKITRVHVLLTALLE